MKGTKARTGRRARSKAEAPRPRAVVAPSEELLTLHDELQNRNAELTDPARDYAETLTEMVREALVVLDASLKVRSANRAFYRTFQTTPEMTEGRDILELLGLETTDPHLRDRLAKANRGQALQDYEVELDGEALDPRTLLLNARPVQLVGEARILLAIDDVTERKAAEVALRASESRYRRIFETAREGIWILDGSNGEILDVNPYLVELVGYPRDQLVGNKPWEIGLFENPTLARQRFRATRSNGFSFEPEVALKTQDGRRVQVEAITNTYDLAGRPIMPIHVNFYPLAHAAGLLAMILTMAIASYFPARRASRIAIVDALAHV